MTSARRYFSSCPPSASSSSSPVPTSWESCWFGWCGDSGKWRCGSPSERPGRGSSDGCWARASSSPSWEVWPVWCWRSGESTPSSGGVRACPGPRRWRWTAASFSSPSGCRWHAPSSSGCYPHWARPGWAERRLSAPVALRWAGDRGSGAGSWWARSPSPSCSWWGRAYWDPRSPASPPSIPASRRRVW